MLSVVGSICALLSLFASRVRAECFDRGVKFPENSFWIRNDNFNVTCANGKIQVVNCISDLGTVIPLMTDTFVENGVEYSCVDSESKGNDEEVSSGEEPLLCSTNDEYISNNFLISCTSNTILACVDKNGDTVINAYFVLSKGQLKYCNIYDKGRKGRIENKGCFKGTDYDDVNNEALHVKKYAIWADDDFDLRCGDYGIQVYRCRMANRTVYAGSAWFDRFGEAHFCI